MGRHTLRQDGSMMHCERSEHCDQGYQHFGPCPPAPEPESMQSEPKPVNKTKPGKDPKK